MKPPPTQDPSGILRLRTRNRETRPRITVELAVSGPVNDRMAWTQTRAITRPAVPCVAVPTTAGTGAEVTANAVLPSPEHRRKASLRSPLTIPAVALADPQLTGILPAAGHRGQRPGCAHPVPGTAGLAQASPLTDALAAEGLRHATAGLRARLRRRRGPGGAADMAACALLGGISPANAKLGAAHSLAGIVGAMADVPHGIACAALLALVIETNVRALRSGPACQPAVDRYDRAARLLTGQPAASIQDGLT